ncbi:hypothetical protein Acor_69200 [Acrocarpospora corrugata]|uniref:TIGR04222 domain-containing membrane protein n=1 Tax=Acrocarpospora corrugata TaxID=35763 RepID=A0A5M3WA09_9ACTN|nr:TIGR04222 domain-containing membrane protein [Acrocarpospora corrugata]GES04852.1 hypothetical protein Acor_69200 [Acrocarpospora corrugata]
MELVLLVPAFVIAVLIVSISSSIKREHRRVRSVHPLGGPPLEVYELAYLAGGPRRTVNTAIALLSAQGRLRVSRGGRLAAVSGSGGSREAVEQEVLNLASVPGGQTAGAVRRAMAEGPALIGIMHRLTGRGYMVPETALAQGRSYNRILGWFAALSGINWVLSVVLIATQAVPVGVGNILAVISGAFFSLYALIRHQANQRTLRSLLTRAGYDSLSAARVTFRRGSGHMPIIHSPVHGAYGVNDNTFAYAAVGGAVALYGLGEFNSPDADEIAREDHMQGSSGGGCAAGACGGGGGSSDFGGSWGSDPGGFGGGDFSSGGSSDSGGGSSCGGGGSSCGGGGCGGGS